MRSPIGGLQWYSRQKPGSTRGLEHHVATKENDRCKEVVDQSSTVVFSFSHGGSICVRLCSSRGWPPAHAGSYSCDCESACPQPAASPLGARRIGGLVEPLHQPIYLLTSKCVATGEKKLSNVQPIRFILLYKCSAHDILICIDATFDMVSGCCSNHKRTGLLI